MTSSPATDWSVAFIRELIANGLEHIVVSPGSRSQSLALAAAQWEQVPGSPLTVHVVIDERSAAFVALGLAMESTRPVACVSTSGSAPAHFLPAALEALHQGVPLILVSADRPSELRGVGANQTTDHVGLMGPRIPLIDIDAPQEGDASSARAQADEAMRLALTPGPVHVNVAFREPLSASATISEKDLPTITPIAPAEQGRETAALSPDAATLVVAGAGAGASAEAWARALGAPLIAEVSSGARMGPHLVLSYRDVLRESPLVANIRRVISVGRPTLSREVWSLLTNKDVTHIAVRGLALEVPNPSLSAQIVDDITIEGETGESAAQEWLSAWVRAGRQAHARRMDAVQPAPADLDALTSDDQATRSSFATAEMQVLREPVTRPMLALGVWESTWPHDRLVLGASRMIREIDIIAPGKNISVFANRGLSGIDGTIATARGVAYAAVQSGAGGITRVLLGDLAFLHDVGSLLVEPGESAVGRVHLFVAHDGGGSLFDLLEIPEGIDSDLHSRMMFTPRSVDIESLAKAYGWEYARVVNRGDLVEALSRSDQRLIVDVMLERSGL